MQNPEIPRFDAVLDWGNVPLSTTPTPIFDSSIPLRTPTLENTGVQIRNSDPTSIVYIGYGPTVSSAKAVKQLSPGQYWEELMGIGIISRLWAVADTGTPNITVARLQ